MPNELFRLKSDPKRLVRVILADETNVIYWDEKKQERNMRSRDAFREKFERVAQREAVQR